MNTILEQIEKLNPEDQLEIVNTVWSNLAMPEYTLTAEEKDSIRRDIKNSEDKPETLELARDFLLSLNKKYFPDKKYI